MIIATASNAYLLFFKVPPTREAFLARAQARSGTYAAELMGDLYDEVFRHSVELRKEYQNYYAIEYPLFSDFIESFGYFPEEVKPKADSYYTHYQVIIPFYPRGAIYENEEGLELLANVFNLSLNAS